MIIVIVLVIFIVAFTFFTRNKSVWNIFSRFLFSTFLSFIIFLATNVFGPFVYIKYTNCLESQILTIDNNIRIFELSFQNAQSQKQYSRYQDDHSMLCVDTVQSKDCTSSQILDGIKLIRLDTNEILSTGTLLKEYSLNAFVDSFAHKEIIIKNKKYWVYFDECFEFSPEGKRGCFDSFKERMGPFCMFYKIRNLKILY